jgi:hypothetical protein
MNSSSRSPPHTPRPGRSRRRACFLSFPRILHRADQAARHLSAFARHTADERIREEQQGLGKPIIAAKSNGRRGAVHGRGRYFVSEASVYRLLKAHDLITSPAYIVIKAAEEFKDKTTAPNQLWQTDHS